MSWTEDRVEILKTLWVKGLSASQIAGELGGGVTRNAVIGKVHRLKLAARAKPATSSARRAANKTTKRATRKTTANNYSTSRSRTVSSTRTVGATALKQSPEAESEIKVAREDVVIPLAERIFLIDLKENDCRWPNGDPLNSDFHFCGKKSLDGKPYCEAHSKRAYHKMDRKKAKT